MGPCYPDKKEFLRLSRRYNLIPVRKEVLADLETPVSAYMKLGDRPYSYLLESVEGGQRMARYSIIGASESMVFQSSGRTISVTKRQGRTRTFQTATDPLNELEKIMRRYRQAPVEGLPPFSGGAVGYFGYDMVRFIEKIPDKNPDRFGIPESFFILTDTLLVFDHLKRKILIIANSAVDDFASPSAAYEAAVKKIETEALKLRRGRIFARAGRSSPSGPAGRIESNFSFNQYKKAVLKAKQYIKKGDIIQVVLSRMLKTRTRAGALDIYRGLRSINPSPYMFYLDCGAFKLVGSSPEVHVRCEDGKAILRPIAGTRPRGADAREDSRLERELLADPKERAEHVMLVDLGRNDLGRVCRYRSVRVTEFMAIERYSHVMHIVSLVEGLLKKDKSIYDLLRATFPAGTVSGAPKVRAMEIIDELETQKRGFYAGVVGHFSFSGNLNTCIAIRTFLIKGKYAITQAGGGIVADSVPRREYLETQNKARALFKAVELAESGALS